MKKKYKGIIFDLDGTLLDTLYSLAISMNSALKKLHFPEHPVERYKILVGEGVQKLVQRALPPDVAYDQKIFTTALTEFKNEYAQRWRQETALYPGIKELLDELGETSCKKAILSNKPHEYTIEVVAHFLANWNFDIIWGAREEVPRKPDPTAALEISRNWQLTPGSLIFVGDTSIDMQTAAAAGMYSVGVTWGFRPEELPKGAHDLIVHTPAEIVSLI